MRDEYDGERGVTYIGPRTFVVGFAAYCAALLVILYGVERMTESFESQAPAAALMSARETSPLDAPILAVPLSARQPAIPAAALNAQNLTPLALRRSPVRAAPPKTLCAAIQPCAVRTASKAILRLSTTRPAILHAAFKRIPALSTPRPVRVVHAAPPRASTRLATPEPVSVARAAPRRAGTAVASTAPASAARTPAALLVTFKATAALTPNGGLDARPAAQAPPIIGPPATLAPAAARSDFAQPRLP